MALCISAECFRAKFAFCTPQHSEVVLPRPGLTPGIPQPRGDPIPPTPGAGSCWESSAAVCVCPPQPSQNIFAAFSRAPPPAIFPAAAQRHLDRAELISSFLPLHPSWLTEPLGSQREPQTPPRNLGGRGGGAPLVGDPRRDPSPVPGARRGRATDFPPESPQLSTAPPQERLPVSMGRKEESIFQS